MKTSFKIRRIKEAETDKLLLQYKNEKIIVSLGRKFNDKDTFVYKITEGATDFTIINAISTIKGIIKSTTVIAKGIEKNIAEDIKINTWDLLLEIIRYYSPSFISKIAKDYESDRFILCVIDEEAYPVPAIMYNQVRNHLEGTNITFPSGRVKGYIEVIEEFAENFQNKSLFVAKDAEALNILIAETLFGSKKNKINVSN